MQHFSDRWQVLRIFQDCKVLCQGLEIFWKERARGNRARIREHKALFLIYFSYALLGNIPVTTTTKISQKYCDTNGRGIAIQMGGALRYKREEYLTIFPFPQSVGAPKVLRYKLEAYCNTLLGSRGGWGF